MTIPRNEALIFLTQSFSSLLFTLIQAHKEPWASKEVEYVRITCDLRIQVVVAIHWEFLVCNWGNISSHPRLWVSKHAGTQTHQTWSRPRYEVALDQEHLEASRQDPKLVQMRQPLYLYTECFYIVHQLCDIAWACSWELKKVLDWGLLRGHSLKVHDCSCEFWRDLKNW